MTIEIDRERKARALEPPQAAQGLRIRRCTLLWSIGIFGAVAMVAGLILAGLDFAEPRGLHYAVYAASCFVLSGLAGGLICINAILADRREFYRRGQLDGWMKGWRGQEPEVDDPLLR
jgi:hypothetical protein